MFRFNTEPGPIYFPDENNSPVNLVVSRRPQWDESLKLSTHPPPLPPPKHHNPVPLPAPSLGPPVVTPSWEKVQDKPVDFSKKKPDDNPLKVGRRQVPRESIFHRNLLVLVLRKINEDPTNGRNIVKMLKVACTHVKTNGCSGRSGSPHQAGQGAGFNSGGGANFSGYSSSGGGSPHSIRSSSTENDDTLFDPTIEFSRIDFNLPATRRWLNDNPEFNPLKILDHISLKNGFGDQIPSEIPKPPPDLPNIDREVSSILQLAVPVPDPSATFMDIGTDFGPMSMYEDDPFNLEQVNPSNFVMSEPQYDGNRNSRVQQQQQQIQQQQHLLQQQQQLQPEFFQNYGMENMMNLEKEYLMPQIKTEPVSFIKEENPGPLVMDNMSPDTSPLYQTSTPSPLSSTLPPTPGKRKRSFSMTEEEDLTNVPSLQVRIQILQPVSYTHLTLPTNREV